MLSNYRLPNQLPHEKVLKIVRKDFFILLKLIVSMIILAVLPLVFFYLILIASPEIFKGEVSYPIIVLSASAYYLFVWLFSFFSFIDYYLDVWIITDERIIDIEQRGFFSRVISEQKLSRIQDVTSETSGAIQTLLGYGDVFVQTAAERERFFFHEISCPDGVRDMIIKLVEENKRRHHKHTQK
ncbi:MAG: PH domain-containing protein [bacterium]